MRRIALGVVMAVLATLICLTPATAQPGFRLVSIEMSDGVCIQGNVFEPAGPGPHPAVIFPASWAINQIEYLGRAADLAARGYVVLSYTQRGFLESGGLDNVAGPREVADARQIIDWVIENTSADPRRIGMAGISYGGGIPLLTASQDPRVRAVAAMSTWSDLVYTLYPNETRAIQDFGGLVAAGIPTTFGRFHPQFAQQIVNGFTFQNLPDLIAYGRSRSPMTYIDGINAHGTAVMIANAWGDSIFPPNQVVEYFNRLRVPKRLELAPGDHATPEGLGALLGPAADLGGPLTGINTAIWDSVTRWMDRYLKGVDSGIDREAPVVLTVRNTKAREYYGSWADVTGRVQTLGLGPVRDGDGALTDRPRPGWAHTIAPGIPTTAESEYLILTHQAFESFNPIPPLPLTALPAISRANAGVWATPPARGVQRIRGNPRFQLTVTPDVPTTTFVAYLFDVCPDGAATPITHIPFSLRDVRPGKAYTVASDMYSIAYDLAPGHRLAFVVDGSDALYADVAPVGSHLTFTSPVAAPSVVAIPLR